MHCYCFLFVLFCFVILFLMSSMHLPFLLIKLLKCANFVASIHQYQIIFKLNKACLNALFLFVSCVKWPQSCFRVPSKLWMGSVFAACCPRIRCGGMFVCGQSCIKSLANVEGKARDVTDQKWTLQQRGRRLQAEVNGTMDATDHREGAQEKTSKCPCQCVVTDRLDLG